MKKARGSALIIAILLIGAIGTIAFSFGRVLIVETANATLYENGTVAYYSAESGVEEGFLRYRYDMNAEVPLQNWALTDTGKVFRSDLTSDSMVSSDNAGISKSTAAGSGTDQIYDLRMGYIGTNGLPFYGNDTTGDGKLRLSGEDIIKTEYGTGAYNFLNIAKDESIKIDITGIDLRSNTINLLAKFSSFSGEVVNDYNSIMEAKIAVNDTNGMREYKTILSPNQSGSCSNSAVFNKFNASDILACQEQTIATIPIPATPAQTISWSVSDLIGKWISQMEVPAFNTPSPDRKVTLYLKPLFHNAVIGMTTAECATNGLGPSCNNSTNVVAGPNTTITSTGYYAGSTRTISANIDRQNGTLYDLFDYVIYSAN